jgi:tetratricopeptide (TPR) repeat protein
MKITFTVTLLLTSLTAFSQNLSLDTGETYAVVVGISDYQDPQIPDLRFADKDALAFAGFLQSPAGGELDEDHLKVLVNEQATAGQVISNLYWLLEASEEGDRVIIYFSGHGDVENIIRGNPGHLLCWDAPSRVYMAGGTLQLMNLQSIISTLSLDKKAKVYVITDACRSGKLSGSGVNGPKATTANLSQQYANEIKILSCQPDEYSIEGEQWGGGRGAFSYHLLDGLYGMADGNSDLNINLKEIGRYLEDNVTEEVSPEVQNPMTIGDRTEQLTTVFPDILEQIKENRKGQMQLFSSTESRGIEDDVLASVDSTTQEIYAAFKRALDEKEFLVPVDACADTYYEVLIKEPKLEQLYSSMRRNYAAALQDDAQQVMNTMLKTGLTKEILFSDNASELYFDYPKYLERASQLLGEEHYMYKILQARKYLFKGLIDRDKKEKRKAFHKALKLQPNMPHAMTYLISSFEPEQKDSALFYFQQAVELIPSWNGPYRHMAKFYQKALLPEKEEEMLNMAGNVDTNSVLVSYLKADFYSRQKKYNLSEKWYIKTINGIADNVCFPCAHLALGITYTDYLGQPEKGIIHFKKAIELDSINEENSYGYCSYCGFSNLSVSYSKTGQLDKAESALLNSIQINPNFHHSYSQLGHLYYRKKNYPKAIEAWKKGLELDSSYVYPWGRLGSIYIEQGQYDLAEKYIKKAIQLDTRDRYKKITYYELGRIYFHKQQLEKAESTFLELLEVDSTYAIAWTYMGTIYQKQGKFSEAETSFKRAIEEDPKFIDNYVNMGDLYLKTERLDAAKASIDKALELDPNNGFAKLCLARWSMKTNRPNEAWVHLIDALEKGYNYVEELNSEPDFEEMRKDPKWNELLQKYFPDENKK